MGNFDCSAVACFLVTMKMPLQFDINISITKTLGQTFNRASRFFHSTISQGGSYGAVVAASQANKSASVFSQLFLANRTFLFPRRAQLHFGDQAAEILVAGARGDKKRKAKISDFQFPISNF